MSRFVRSKKISRSPQPLIVGSVTTLEGLKSAAAATEAICDIVEVRFDLMPKMLMTHFTRLFHLLDAIELPVLATLRSSQEGGKCAWPLNWRLDFLDKIATRVELIDLELVAAANCAEKVTRYRDQGLTVVLSHHDFSKLPGNAFIQKKIDAMHGFGAQIAKVAGLIKNQAELERLLVLMEKQKKPVSLMGMGKLATQSRVELGRRGSVLNYGYFDRPAAPGQIYCGELKALISPSQPEVSLR